MSEPGRQPPEGDEDPSAAGGARRSAGRLVALIWHKTFQDRILGLAAEAGFWALVSLPSMLLAIFGALGYLRGIIGSANVERVHADVLRAAGDVLTPATVSSDVAPILDQVLARGHLEVISIGFLISLWSGSTAMSDYLNTITVAYGMRGLRGTVRSRLVALWLYLCALVGGIVLLPALALGPDLITRLFPDTMQDQAGMAVHIIYWPGVAVLSVGLLSMLYKACLPVRVRWRRGLPGATVAMALWVVFSLVVRAYLTSSFRQRSAYGSLAAPIAGLLFFYFTALAVLLGAEINSAIDVLHPERSTEDGRARSKEKVAAGGPPSPSHSDAEALGQRGPFDALGAPVGAAGADPPPGPPALPASPGRPATPGLTPRFASPSWRWFVQRFVPRSLRRFVRRFTAWSEPLPPRRAG